MRPTRRAGRAWLRPALSLLVSGSVLALIYGNVDRGALVDALLDADRRWLALELGLLPLVPALYTVRLMALLPPGAARLSPWTAARVVVSCQTLNALLPSKGGELVKGWFLTRDGVLTGYRAASLVLVERLLESAFGLGVGLAGLLLLREKGPFLWGATAALSTMVGGLAFLLLAGPVADGWLHRLERVAPGRWGPTVAGFRAAWREGLGTLWSSPRRGLAVTGASAALAVLYLLEAWVLVHAVGGGTTFVENAAFLTLSSVASALPLTVGGLGARDAAAVTLYGTTMPAAVAAAFGLLLNLRQLALAALGLPFLPGTLARGRAAARGTSDEQGGGPLERPGCGHGAERVDDERPGGPAAPALRQRAHEE